MNNTIRNISLTLSDFGEDFKKLHVFGWIMSPILITILLIIYILAGVIALITLLDMFFKFLMSKDARRKLREQKDQGK